MKKNQIVITVTIFFIVIAVFVFANNQKQTSVSTLNSENQTNTQAENQDENLPMVIESLRKRNYPASEIVIEETLAPGVNYNRYIASYKSDGLKIYGLFTVPASDKPEKGFPSIVFLHGYLPPKEYITTERYVAYQDGFARNGFITFKPDLRGHGRSEGNPVNSNFSEDYVIDTLNLVSTLKSYKDTDPSKIGMWGHSNGGNLTLRSMVISRDIKAGIMWAGVVGSYEDLLERYRKRIPWMNNISISPSTSSGQIPSASTPQQRLGQAEQAPSAGSSAKTAFSYVEKYGNPSASSKFWTSIDPYYYLKDISGPVELHHGTADDSVPIELSRHLKEALKKEGKQVELFEYDGADHNLSDPAFTQAMQRSIDFFKKNL